MSAPDPVTLAVIQNGLQQVCDEMDLAFSRAAFSPVIAEADDRSDGIYDPVDGSLIAQGQLGLPVFVGTMQFSTRILIEMIRDGRCQPPEEGDIYIVNDPYLGGTHLMDVRFAMPFYVDGDIFCWLSNTGHWPDIGGAVPGGFSANATAVEQEGLRLPPVKLFKRGEMDPEIYSIICSNIRVADQRIGDIKAQAAALSVGKSRLQALLARYGKDVVQAAIEELRKRAASQMRARLEPIPDGRYQGRAFVDSDGVVDEPLTIDLVIEKRDGDLHFDFSASSPPCQGPMNSVLATTCSSVYLAVRHIFPDVPINAGAFEPLHIEDPAGTFLDARYPRPVSGCAAEVSQRIAEAVFAALAPVLPDKVTAAPAGTSGNFALGGYDPEKRRAFVMYQLTGGGYGGHVDHDGLTNGCSTIGISKTPPIEVMEQIFPVLYRHYALREGSGGAGKRRGGFGVDYSIELRRGEARASFVMDHGRFGPQGALGGEDGMTNSVTVWRQGEAYIPPHLSKDQDIAITAGDRVDVGTPGGGGYGDPLERDPAAVLRDVQLGYYTSDQALDLFGVALTADLSAVDGAATEKRRASKKDEDQNMTTTGQAPGAAWREHPRYPDPLIETLDPRFEGYRIFSAAVERLYTGCRWSEGPVWIGDARCLLWSDIPNNRMLKWDETSGEVSEYRTPSDFANGNTRDRRGRLVTCEHGGRRVTRTDYDGTVEVLVDHIDGKRLNSPNDVVVKSDGSIWFTDPVFGILGNYEGHKAESERPQAVYRIDGESGEVTVIADDILGPNGLCFSPDESLLYIVESRGEPYRKILAYDVTDDGRTIRNKRVLIDAGPGGTPDGMRCDIDGNLWCGWGMGSEGLDGVLVFAPDGTKIGRIALPERCANVCFGGIKRNRLFMAASQSLYALYVNTQGAPGG